MRRLLHRTGSIWINIDDNEAHYLKVLMDELFGRVNFVANVLWQKVYSDRMDAKEFSASHDHILVYKRDDQFRATRLSMEQNDKQFSYVDEATGKSYRRRSLRKEGSNSRREDRPNLWYAIRAPDASKVFPIKPSGVEGNWRWSKDTYDENAKLGVVEWVNSPRGTWEVYVKQFKDDEATRPPNTWWTCDEVGHNHEAKEEARSFNANDMFATPKPERLIQRILAIATNPGDWVLDSFAGSGTTGAVAHKMGRRWIMVELGDHCRTHIIPRLKQVVEGKDPGGVTEASGWKGGGGFRYYRLAPSLLEKDQFGNWVINRKYNPTMLAEAICKLEGFAYDPSDTVYWQYGRSTEKDFIYITTQTLTREQIQKLSDEVGEARSLLVMCAAFRVKNLDAFPNLTIKKIPKAVLSRCEWGHDDYSLEIRNLPVKAAAEEPTSGLPAEASAKTGKRPRTKAQRREQTTLFDMDGDKRSQ